MGPKDKKPKKKDSKFISNPPEWFTIFESSSRNRTEIVRVMQLKKDLVVIWFSVRERILYSDASPLGRWQPSDMAFDIKGISLKEKDGEITLG